MAWAQPPARREQNGRPGAAVPAVNEATEWRGLGVALGIGVGTVIGVLQGNVAIGIAVGIAIGIAIGEALARNTPRH
jgi:hypothetical protein